MAEIIVTVNNQDIEFDVGIDDVNQYINDTMPNDKVAPSHNLLVRTVKEDSKEALMSLIMRDGKPNGLVVNQIASEIVRDFNGDVQVTLKKPKG